MAVYYKFKSAKDYDSIPIDGHFITVATLKEKIYESKQLGRGTDYDLVVTHAQTGEEYLDEGMLIAKNTTVLIRRVPGRPRMPIVTAPVTDQDEQRVENRPENVEPTTNNFQAPDPSVSNYFDGSEYDEFGNDLYEIPEVTPVTSSNPVQDAPPPSKADEDDKIKALVDTPALDWQRQNFDGFGPGRGYGRGMGGRMGGRGFGRGGLAKTPPEGYICHRCKTPGHFIQHCPTNGDPNFDIKRVKPPTGIPKSMLQPTPDGVYALPSGAVGLWKPNEAAFEKEIEGMPSTRNVGDLPPELHCPLCKEVMKDAVLTSKCCFQSFCDKCIRDHIMSKSACVCGATNVLADDLLPNKTLRDTINRILESNNSSADIGGNALQLQDMESARCPQPKVPSPSLSVASRGEQAPPPPEKSERVLSTVVQDQTANIQQQVLEKGQIMKVPDVSEATHESKSVKEHVSQGSARPADEEVQQKQVLGEAAKKKKKKKAHLPMGVAEMQWRGPQDFATENYMMPPGPSPYNPYWNPMQPGMEAYLGPYGGGGPMPYNMGYGLGPFDVPFGNVLPQDPFGVPGYMMPPIIPPQRDLADLSMGFNAGLPPGPPIMSREEFEARKAELRRKREMERRVGSREQPRDQEFGREASNNGDISSMKLKSKPGLPPSSSSAGADHHHTHRHRSERPSPDRRPRSRSRSRSRGSPLPPPRPSSKRKTSSSSTHHEDHDHDDAHHQHHHRRREHHHRSESSSATARPPPPPLPAPEEQLPPTSSESRKHKPSVFSRISFPGGEEEATAAPAASSKTHSKKRKVPESSAVAGGGGGGGSSSSTHHSKSRGLSNGYHDDNHSYKPSSKSSSSAAAAVSAAEDHESSDDDDRHFKRRPSRYESSPVKERERDRRREDRAYSKHR